MAILPNMVQFQGHHTNQTYYKLGIMSPEYPETPIEMKHHHILETYTRAGYPRPIYVHGQTGIIYSV